ncbi:malectin domain-containing carbohydrate-binding protein [Halococcus sediminicola]|uniref:malectin domain-containing carbohydrate-binding protein n=1 Tax=Halococcus sediminicola TaxID=1264579 RepID=UPI001377DA87|nr:malectin domain-containing carbohydrate-binding protein [Halococcus sediminicola]
MSAAGLAMIGGLATPVAADHDIGTGAQYPDTCEGPGFNDTPQLPDSPWQVHDACRPQPPAVDSGEPAFPDPPADATVLMSDGEDGSITLDDWNNSSSWEVNDNYVIVGDEPLVSRDGFGDGHYHIEWRTPTSVTGSGQEPGNSGFFLSNRYEIQILNNYENSTFSDGYAASVFGQHPPLANASRPKGSWQIYDIIWRAPRFADNGDLKSPGVVTIYWNDVLVQSQTVLNGPTAYRTTPEYSQHPVEAPIQIQNHGQPVHFRNVWYQSGPTPASVVEFDDDLLTAESTSSSVDASVVNKYDSEMTNGNVTLTPQNGSEVTVTPQDGTSFGPLAVGDSQSVSWEVTRPNADSGPHLLKTSTSYSVNGSTNTIDFQIPVYPEPSLEAPSEPASYTKTVLSDRMDNLVDLAVADDGRVFYITRGDFFGGVVGGTTEVGVYDPETDEDTVALEIDVFTGINMEDGGQGISLDPNFEENGWIYIYYSPSNETVAENQEELDYLNQAGNTGDDVARLPSESIGNPYNLLSRVTMENGSIDPASETEILRVPVQRDTCCHEGGDIQWGPNGDNLYLTTGDNTYSKVAADNGFAPLDEREDRDYFDAQRTSSNTADLRGKILRIIPQDDGSYTIPEDNLKAQYENETGQSYSEEEFLPEIYVMGVRNPFQAGVDLETGTLLWGDYSADSRTWSDIRGPPGFNEFNRATSAGNYGWPYFTGPYPFYDYDYETQNSGNLFDENAPINDSPHSNGIQQLPATQDPFIWYPGNWDQARQNVPSDFDVPEEVPFPAFEGGAPIGGPIYRHQDSYTERGLPAWHEGDYIIAEWGAGWLKTVSFENDDVADGRISQIRPLASGVQFSSPIDLELGPEGMLYVAEYGGFSGEGSKLSRIERQEVQSISAPFGYDAGGELLDGTVTINGLDYVASSPAVEATGDASASSTGTTVGTYSTDESIADTENDALYQTEQFGGDLSYEVTMENGTYDVVLHFAETNSTLQEGDRVFNVSVEGQQVYSPLDILAKTDRYTALNKTVRGVEVTDGTLNISSETLSDNSKFMGFAILPSDGPIPSETITAPFGYDAGGELLDGTVTINGLDYVASSPAVEMYGDASASSTNTEATTNLFPDPPNSIGGTEYDPLYQTESFGGDLSYNVGVENGTYDVTLYFAETNTGIPEGQRVFNVSVEGTEVFSEFDIATEAGYNQAYQQTFEGIEVTDGILSIATETLSDNSKFSGLAVRSSDGGGVIEPGTTIELGGEIGGWIGEAPSSIEGETNPMLTLQEGATYTVAFENLDGYPHDFYMLDENENELVGTELVTGQGGTASVEFTASQEMVEYYCSVHPIQMRGDVTIQDGGGSDGPPAIGDSDSAPTDPDDDGLYEDLDGDGEVTDADAELFFEHIDDPEMQNNVEAFDFNGNGRLDFDDVVEWRKKKDDM